MQNRCRFVNERKRDVQKSATENPILLQDTSSNNSNKIRFRYEIDDTQNYLSINELNGEIRMEDNIKKLGKAKNKRKLCSHQFGSAINKIHLAN